MGSSGREAIDARLADQALDDVHANRIVHGLLGKTCLYP